MKPEENFSSACIHIHTLLNTQQFQLSTRGSENLIPSILTLRIDENTMDRKSKAQLDLGLNGTVKTPVKNKSQIVPHLIREKCGQYLCPTILTDMPKFGSPSGKWEEYWKAQEAGTKKVCTRKTKNAFWVKKLHRERINTEKNWLSQLEEGTLDIPHLGLVEIPESIFMFSPPLKVIHLHDNEIRELPQNFFERLPQLAWADLRKNRLKYLPALTQPHNSLRVLLLQENKLVSLTYSLSLATSLKSINLTGNPIQDPPSRVRKGGCKAILGYLRYQFEKKIPDFVEEAAGEGSDLEFSSGSADDQSSSSSSELDSDALLKEKEQRGQKKRRPFAGRTRIISAVANKIPWTASKNIPRSPSAQQASKEKKSLDNLKYS
jgi:hypothetical protein